MKNKLLVLLFVLYGLDSMGQFDSLYHYKVNYEMKLNFFGPISYNANFSFNNSQSLFEYKETFGEDKEDDTLEDADGNIYIKNHDKSLLYIKINRQKNLIREYVGDFDKKVDFEIEESIPIIFWNISDDTKKINQHICSKATCTFRGRNYTVWFTTDIQTNLGPLKLNGLPGLILEISDDTKEVYLFAKTVNMEECVVENKPSNLKVIPRTEFRKKFEKSLKKAEEAGKILSSRMDRGFKVSFKISKPKSIEMDYDF
ncbi:MAG: GLPGLI family protein [Prolixibacteraceae bacterium]